MAPCGSRANRRGEADVRSVGRLIGLGIGRTGVHLARLGPFSGFVRDTLRPPGAGARAGFEGLLLIPAILRAVYLFADDREQLGSLLRLPREDPLAPSVLETAFRK